MNQLARDAMRKSMRDNTCYVLPKVRQYHPIAEVRHDDVEWYPETAMSLLEQIGYKRLRNPVVTESPWIIANYDYDDVYMWRDGRWVNPAMQTYCATYSTILHEFIGYNKEIPAMPWDGGRDLKKLDIKLQEQYLEAQGKSNQ